MSLPALDREVSHVSSKVSASNAGDKGRIARLRSGVWGAAGRAASVASVATLGTLNAQPPSDAQRKAEMVQLNGFTGVFPVPAPGCRPNPPAALTTSQSEAYDRMLRYFKEQVTQYPISLSPGAAKEPATDWEKLRLLSRESLLRYLRAAKWDVQQAQKRLVETIAWRREFGVDKLDADEMAHEAKSGKETVLGYDNKARPLHYMHPHRNDTKETPRQMQFAVWILERSVDLMPPGIEQLALLINFDHRSRNPTSIANAKLMLYILQNHYVERLGIALCINVPWIFKAFWSAIQPFIDPVTKSKCKFDEAIKDEVPSEQLSADFGGSLDPKYNHDAYWPDLVKTCDERREAMLRRFQEDCGAQVGASEWVILGGDDKASPFNKKDLAELKKASADSGDVDGGQQARNAAIRSSDARSAGEPIDQPQAAPGLGPDDPKESMERFQTANGYATSGAEPKTPTGLADSRPVERFVTPTEQLSRSPIDRHFSQHVKTTSPVLEVEDEAGAGTPARVGTADTSASASSPKRKPSGARSFFDSLRRHSRDASRPGTPERRQKNEKADSTVKRSSTQRGQQGPHAQRDLHGIAAQISTGMASGATAFASALQHRAEHHTARQEALRREEEQRATAPPAAIEPEQASAKSAHPVQGEAVQNATTATVVGPSQSRTGSTSVDEDQSSATTPDGKQAGEPVDTSANATTEPPNKPISVLFFASARDAAGLSELQVQLPRRSFPLSELGGLILLDRRAALAESKQEGADLETLQRILETARWSVNEEMVDEDALASTLLHGGEEVAPITPVSGG